MKKYIKSVDYSKYLDPKDTSEIDISKGNCTKRIFNLKKWFFNTYLKELSCEGDLESRSPRDFILITFLPRFGANSEYCKFKMRCPTNAEKCANELVECIQDECHSKFLAELDSKFSISDKNLKVMDEDAFLEKKIKSLIDCNGTYYDYFYHDDRPNFQVWRNRYGTPIISIYEVSKKDVNVLQEFIDTYSAFTESNIETEFSEEKRGFSSSPSKFTIVLNHRDARVVVDGRMHAVKYLKD